MTNAIVVANEWQAMKDQAMVLVKSGLLPKAVDTPEKAIVIMLQGRELGIGYMQALNGINVIQGKPTVSPQLMLALIQRSGELEDMAIADDGNACTVTMKRRGKSAHSETFSMSDASAMGLSGKDNWRKQPVVMRKWRAVSACSRVIFSDVTMGLYTFEEINPDVSVDAETGEIVEVTALSENADSGQPDAPQQHWTKTQDWKKFYTYATRNLGLSREEVHEALEVESAKLFPGRKLEANQKLVEYAQMKAEHAKESLVDGVQFFGEECVGVLIADEIEAAEPQQVKLSEFFAAASDEDAIAAIQGA